LLHHSIWLHSTLHNFKSSQTTNWAVKLKWVNTNKKKLFLQRASNFHGNDWSDCEKMNDTGEIYKNFWHNDTDFNLNFFYRWFMEGKTFLRFILLFHSTLSLSQKQNFSGEKAQFKLFLFCCFYFGSKASWKSIIVSCARLPLSMRESFFVYSQYDLRVVGTGKWEGGWVCLFADDAVFGAKWIFNVMNGYWCLLMFIGKWRFIS
jgi:hypothetical protein